MTAQEVIDLAKNGELKQLAVKSDTDAVIGFVNLGLLELYKRFPIETNEYGITLVDGVSEYTLPTNFMWVMSATGTFTNEDGTVTTRDILVNARDTTEAGIVTVAWNKIKLINTTDETSVQITYTAKPVKVTALTLNDELAIPEQMIEALLNYIGYRGHGSVDGKINTESNTHYQRFEMSVARIQKDGMFTAESLDMSNRIKDKGFV